MGKGDIKTRRGKLIKGSYGVRRPTKKHKKNKKIISLKTVDTKPVTKKAPSKKEEVISEIIKPETKALKPQEEKKEKEVKSTKETVEVKDDKNKSKIKVEKKSEEKSEIIVKAETVIEKPKKKESAKIKDKD